MAALLTFGAIVVPIPAVSTAAPNPIVVENQQQGTTSWKFTDYNKAERHEIEGYASLTSVNKGSQISFMVSLSSSAQYTMDFYRMGWYPQGTNPDGTSCAPSCGGRLMMHVGPLAGSTQAACPQIANSSDPNYGMTECSWSPSYTLTVPTTWTTGNYIVKLTRLDGAHLENWMTFVVRDDSSTAPVVYSLDVSTWQAYNFWGGTGNNNVGINLYGRTNDVTYNNISGSRAYTVSFNRPYLVQGSIDGAGSFMVWDFPLIRWMESQGYDMTYVTSVDLESRANLLSGHRVFVNTGHDEYYSDNMRNNIKNGIASGVNMAFFSANNIYFRVTWGADAAGQSLRRVHCDKGAQTGLATVEWRNLATPQPENEITGVMQNGVATARPFLVYDSSSWIYAGTGLSNYTGNGTTGVITSGAGQNALPGLIGYEFDERATNVSSLSSFVSSEPPGLKQVGHSFVPSSDNGVNAWSDAVLYTAPSGATVFSAGTIQWPYTLDNGYADGFCDCDHSVANAAGQKVTANILNRFVLPSTPTPAASVLPSSLTFASQTTGTTSASKTVTVSNIGTAALAITEITLQGANASDFAQGNTCPLSPSTLAIGASCTISVTFTPSAAGTRSAAVQITDNGLSSPESVSLTGTGAAPAPGVSLTPSSLAFGSWATGATSTPQVATLRNTGSGPLTISSIALAGTNPTHYAQTNTCPIGPATLASGSTCTISVTFKPTATGSRPATLTVTDNAAGSPHNVSLTGTGINPAVTLSPTNLTFTSQAVGTTSAARSTTLTNSGTTVLTITSIAITGTNASDFARTTTCPLSPSTLARNATCTISVTFSPAAGGSRTAGVTINDNAATSPQTVQLTGTGAGAVGAVTLAPSSIAFGQQAVGTTSAAQTTTLTNTGSGPLTIASIGLAGANAGDFQQTNGCPSTLASSASCTISTTFAPRASGSRTGTITISDDASGSPHTVALSGTGLAPAVTLAPTSLTFPTQTIGTTSGSQTVTLTNSGTAPLTIDGISLTGANAGDFSMVSTCPLIPSTLATSASCSIGVTFSPTAGGTRNASVSITDGVPGSPQAVALSGTGAAPAPAVTLTATSLSFAPQAVGTTSASQSATLRNSGTAPLTITSVTVAGTNPGDYARSTDCPLNPSTLAAGATCTISLTFSPTATGSRTASVAITDDAPGSPHSLGLSGSGAAPAVTFSPTSLSFASQTLGTTSAAKTITLTNSGSAPLTIASLGLAGANPGDFTQSNDCPAAPATLSAGGSCTISITFSPTTGGSRAASVVVTDDAPGSPQTAGLSGTGALAAPTVSLTPTSLSFSAQRVGTTSGAQSTTLRNTGSAPLTIGSISLTGPNAGDYARTSDCPTTPATLVAGGTCTISVMLTPSATGTRTASVSISDDAAGSPHSLGLSGSGIAPAVSLTPTSIGFGTQLVGTSSSAQSTTVRNPGGAPLAIMSIALGGANAADFTSSSTCPLAPLALSAGATCTISAIFRPSAAGSRSASITITDDAGDSPQSLPLTGNGTTSAIAFDKNLGQKTENVGTSSMTLTTSAAAAVHSRIFVFVSWNDPTRTLTSVTGGGLTFNVDQQAADTNNVHGGIASADAPAGLASGTVLTATFSGIVGHGLVAAVSFTGIASTAPLDAASSTTQAGVAAWTASVTTTNPTDLVLAWTEIDANTTSTAASPNVEINDFGDANYYEWATSSYRIESTAGAKTVNGTWLNASGSTANVTVIAAYKAG